MKRLSVLVLASVLTGLAACGTPSTSVKGSLAASSHAATSAAAAKATRAANEQVQAKARHTTTTGHTTTGHGPRRTTTTQAHSTTLPSVPQQQGVAGAVLSGTTCSTSPNPSTTRCGEQPTAARIKVLNGAGKVVAKGATSDHGAFVIPLAPGSYTLKTTLVGGGSCPLTNVTVASGTYSNTIIHCG